jgi:hypothetical protein
LVRVCIITTTALLSFTALWLVAMALLSFTTVVVTAMLLRWFITAVAVIQVNTFISGYGIRLGGIFVESLPQELSFE